MVRHFRRWGGLILGLGFVLLLISLVANPTEADSVKVSLKRAPKSFQRGRKVTLEGKVKASPKRLKQGMVVSFFLKHQGKRLHLLGRQKVQPDGSFQLQQTLPQELKMQAYELEAVVAVPRSGGGPKANVPNDQGEPGSNPKQDESSLRSTRTKPRSRRSQVPERRNQKKNRRASDKKKQQENNPEDTTQNRQDKTENQGIPHDQDKTENQGDKSKKEDGKNRFRRTRKTPRDGKEGTSKQEGGESSKSNQEQGDSKRDSDTNSRDKGRPKEGASSKTPEDSQKSEGDWNTSELWKQLHKGWGPNVHKKALKKLQQKAQKTQKQPSKFLLPPIGLGAAPKGSADSTHSKDREKQAPHNGSRKSGIGKPGGTANREPKGETKLDAGVPNQAEPKTDSPPKPRAKPGQTRQKPEQDHIADKLKLRAQPGQEPRQVNPRKLGQQGKGSQQKQGKGSGKSRRQRGFRGPSGGVQGGSNEPVPVDPSQPTSPYRHEPSERANGETDIPNRRGGQGQDSVPQDAPGQDDSALPPPRNELEKAQRDGLPLMVPPKSRQARKKASPFPSNTGRRGRKRKGPPQDRSKMQSQALRAKLDKETGRGDIFMRQVFEPYLPHHQRITVLDQIHRGYRLRLRSKHKRIIDIGGKRKSSRAFFKGRIRILLAGTQWTPIPSVSPDARILSYKTTPATELEFAKDGGDLMFVRSTHLVRREVLLEFQTDGSRFYFGGALPESVLPHSYQDKDRPILPKSIRRVVNRNLSVLEIAPQMELHQVMKKIVPYLRSFAARPLTAKEKRGDLLETLLEKRVGVCRHRAVIFTVVMQYLGYPTRFVASGAHAFAEIRFPDGRWKQVDLGGGDNPHWMGSWRGKPFNPPRDPYPNAPKNPEKKPIDKDSDPDDPQLPNGGRDDGETARTWKKQLVPGLASPDSASKTNRKPLSQDEVSRALRRLLKLRKRWRRLPYIIHAPLPTTPSKRK